MEQLKKIDGIGGENVIKSLEDIASDVGRFIIEFAFGEIYPRDTLSLPDRKINDNHNKFIDLWWV